MAPAVRDLSRLRQNVIPITVLAMMRPPGHICCMAYSRNQRIAFKLSQHALAHRAGISRWRLCIHELGDGSLTGEEEHKIAEALQREAARIWQLAHDGHPERDGVQQEVPA